MRRAVKVIAIAMAAMLAPTACGGSSGSSGGSGGSAAAPGEVTVAVGSGIAYAPLTIMQHEQYLEKQYPKTKFVWQQGVSGGAATRDGMLAGKIQVGVAGISPFLIGVDKGVDWRVLGSMGQLGIDLVTIDPKIQNLKDLAASGRPISLPSPDSGQAIALKALGKKYLNNPKAFDHQLTSMGHPDAFQALLAGTTGAAFIGPPFQYKLEEQHGARKIASAGEVFGTTTYSSIVMMKDFSDKYPAFTRAVYTALENSLAMLRDHPDQAATILSQAEGGSNSPQQYQKWISENHDAWSPQPSGYEKWADFMKSVGLISQVPKLSDLMLSTAKSAS